MEHTKTSDGVAIAYFRLGDGPPIVFASNVFGDAHFYQSLHPHTRRMTDALVELGWSVVRYDLRGMGGSDRAVPVMSANALVRDLDAVVNCVGLQRFALAGLHGGAATAVRYAAEHQDRVTHLVLMNPFRTGAHLFETDSVGRALASVAEIAEDDFSFFSLVAGNLMTKFANPDHARDLAATFQRSTSPRTLIAYQEALRRVDLMLILPQLSMPTLVVHDTGFPFGSFAEREACAAAIPRARLLVITGDGEAEIAAIDSFLRSPGEEATVSQAHGPGSTSGARHLTSREIQVLKLVANGKTNREIAALLVLSERTVARHITNIYDKLDLGSRADATAYAIRRGFA